MDTEESIVQETAEFPVLKRCHSLNSEAEAPAGPPPLTYRPKPLFGTEAGYGTFWAMGPCSGYESGSSTLSSFSTIKTSGQGYFSSPLSSIGGKSSNSSPSITGPIIRGSGVPYSIRDDRDVPMLSSRSLCSDPIDGMKTRVSSWAQFLDSPVEVPEEAAERKHLIDMSQLFLGQKFACGAYSRLYRGVYHQREVAVKFVRQPEDDLAIANRLDRQFVQEVSLMSRLHHKNVVEFIGAIRKPPMFCIVTEYLEGGSLRTFLHKDEPQSMSLELVINLALDIARGMEYLHSQGVLHLDLKPHNLVLSNNGRVKITDFGVARLQSECESMTPDSGTYRWMAPEMISNKTFSMKADVFSFGIILWEIITGKTPYDDMSTIQAAFGVVDKNLRPRIPDNCPLALKQLMEECWTALPEKRPPFWQVVQRLEKFQTSLHLNDGCGLQGDCRKRTGLWPLLNKLIRLRK